jgi:hypothetical protein
MKRKIYLAGKVKNTSIDNRIGGWRNQLIKDLFSVDIEMGLNAADYEYPTDDLTGLVLPINNNWEYVGPYLFGCDHRCSHTTPYAHGIANCTSDKYHFAYDENNQITINSEIFKLCVNQISNADVIVVNFDERPLESYGTLTEIGFAYASHIPIYSIGEKHPELWFGQSMTKHVTLSELKNILNKK